MRALPSRTVVGKGAISCRARSSVGGEGSRVPLLQKSFYTESAEDAATALSALYPDFTFQDPARHEKFYFRQLVIGDERGSLVRLDFGGKLVATAELDDQFVINLPLNGPIPMRVGPHLVEMDATRPGLAPPGTGTSVVDHSSTVAANFSESMMEDALRSLHGVDRVNLRYPRLSPRNEAQARLWVESVNYVRHTILTPGVASNESIRRSAFQTLGLVAIDVFGVQVDMATPPPTGTGPASVRRAQVFIDENASLPISVDDIAAAARLSVRGLQLAFQRDLGMTPTQYLRRVRLAHAHAELTASDPSLTTVGAVALRWGFPHQGRFAATYKAAYGQAPGDTLKN